MLNKEGDYDDALSFTNIHAYAKILISRHVYIERAEDDQIEVRKMK